MADSVRSSLVDLMDSVKDSWLESLLLNVAIYLVLVIPAWLFIRYYRKIALGGVTPTGFGPFSGILQACIIGSPSPIPTQALEKAEEGGVDSNTKGNESTPNSSNTTESTALWRGVQLCGCIVGLQTSYVTWGVIQERIITKSYDGDKFTNSQFLVFVNRVLALMVAGILINVLKQPQQIVPFYKYSYSSLSNIVSSWCQYEALKYISFPTQVLAKSCKVIPVMVMGKVVSNKTYPLNEYLTAFMISMGVSMFLLTSSDGGDEKETKIAGVIIICGYLVMDSFTSNWQSELFHQYKMSTLQMMFGVNIFSFTFTSFSLLVRGSFLTSLYFMFSHTEFAFHALVLSICSATGQLFIFYTISTFGPVVFTLIMTSRQAISIIISCLIYGHVLSLLAIVGVVVVFAAILLRVYLKQQAKK